MATITKQVVVLAGIVPSWEACASGGDEFLNSGRCYISIKNAHAADPRTVTIDSQVVCSQGSDHDAVVVVTAANDEKLIGPFPTDRFNDGDGKVQITYSDSAADMSIAVFEVP